MYSAYTNIYFGSNNFLVDLDRLLGIKRRIALINKKGVNGKKQGTRLLE